MRNDLDALDIILIFLAGFVYSLVINNIIFPCEVKAEGYGIIHKSPEYYGYFIGDSGNYIQTTPTLVQKAGKDYFGSFQMPDNTTGILSRYDNTGLNQGSYNISFMIYYYNNLYTPIVLANDTTCQIVYAYNDMLSSDHYEASKYASIYGIYCPDIHFSSDSLYIRTYANDTGYSTGSVGLGISTINYSLSNSQQALEDIKNGINSNNQAIKDQTEQQHQDSQATQDKIQSVDDTLNDGSVDSDAINSIGSNLPETTGPLSAIINLPVRFFQVLLNALNTTTCPVISFNIPWVNKKCTIPCVRNLLQQIGALDFYETIGTMVGAVLLFKYIIYMGKTFQKMSDLEDTSTSTWGGL